MAEHAASLWTMNDFLHVLSFDLLKECSYIHVGWMALVTSDSNAAVNKYIWGVIVVWNDTVVSDVIGYLLLVLLKCEMHLDFLLVLEVMIAYVI